LERALAAGTEAQRDEMLSRITDLFLADAGRYSPEQVHLFDDLLTKFAAVIESKARAKLAAQLAPVSAAPEGVIRTLAFDDDIEVARPVLRQSPRIGDDDLVANAGSKSQDHLLAISQRKALSEAVTDVLVSRGDHQVVHSVAKNPDARFSYAGFRVLVRRSDKDDDLAMLVGSRRDLPRQHLLQLLDAASAAVRARLLAQNPESGGAVQKVLDEVGGTIRSQIDRRSFDYGTARTVVQALQRAGKLNEACVAQFARAGRFEETAIALSLLCEVNVDVVERALLAPGSEVLLILVKLAGFSWESAKAMLQLKAGDGAMSQEALDKALASLGRLNVGTARKVLGFYNQRSQGFAAARITGG
jgi:uncharacterized protein (DUF2336 family)